MKQSYPYAITGGSIVLVAAMAAGAGFWFPFAAIDLDNPEQERATVEYHAMEMRVTDSDGNAESQPYRDARFDDGLGIAALRAGTWLLVGGTFLALCAGITLLAAPSSGLKTARGGGTVGLVAGALLLAAVAAFLMGYMDQGREFARMTDENNDEITLAGNRLMLGTFFIGASAVLAFGGAILGFSDKPKPTTSPATTAPV